MSIQAVSWVLDHSPTEKNDRLVLISLANHATVSPINGAWESWPGLELIAKEARIGVIRTVQRTLERLQAMGAIEVVHHGAPDRRERADRRANLYRILVSHGQDGVTVGVTPSGHPPGDDGVTVDVTSYGVTVDVTSLPDGVTNRADGVTKQGPRGDSHVSLEPTNNQEQPIKMGAGKPPKGSRLPEPFLISDGLRDWAALSVPSVDPDAQLDQFCDYHRAKGTVSKDWDASMRTWLRNAVLWDRQKQPHRPADINRDGPSGRTIL